MPKSASGAGSIRKRADGLWEGRASVGRDPRTGKQIRKSVYGKSQGEVRKKLAAITNAVDDGAYISPAKITFGEWLVVWIDEYCAGLKPRTRALYKNSIDARILPELGAVRLLSLSPAMIQKFYNNALQGHADGKNTISPKTIKNLHGIIHKALKQAVEVGYLKINPAEACKLPKTIKPQIQPMDREHIKSFIETVQEDYLFRLFMVALFTGLRSGEVLGLTWECIDFQNGTINVVKQLQRVTKEYHLLPPKNSKPRTIAPASFVLEVLQDQREEQEQWRQAAGDLWKNENDFVFTNEIGMHFSQQLLHKHLKNAAVKIGLPSLRFHDLRHTYAVAAIQAGDDIKTVSENLGHASVAFTLDVYGHVTEQMKRTSADRMQAFIDSLHNN